MAMVLRANKESSELGGHIATYQSAATLYEVGFNHFWHAPTDEHGGDLVYMQGHSSPGHLRARVPRGPARPRSSCATSARRSTATGSRSYPHPWLMPDFWQFPTVSMGLGPLMAIYQARFMKYLAGRGIADTGGPQGLGVPAATARWTSRSRWARSRWPAASSLDNLVFVVNCNLQRLDGPVRGNGKIIQELETDFRGAGWNVIKVIWGSRWDPLLAARPRRACCVARMEEAVDGEYQTYKSRDGAYVREHFFGAVPGAARDGRATCPTTTSGRSTAAATTRRRSTPPTHEAVEHTGPADRDPRQDDQGLRDGRGRRGPEHHPPAEEDERGGAAAPSATASSCDLTDEQVARRPVLQAAPTTRRR